MSKTGPSSACSARYKDSALRLAALLEQHFEPTKALRRFKRYAAYLAANFAFGNTLYNHIRNAPDMAAARQAAIDFFQNDPPERQRPNLNLLR